MEFRVGDPVVAPGCGVGRIDGIETMDMGDAEVELFRIAFGDDGTKMWVPTNQVAAKGLRPIMDPSRVPDIWHTIDNQELPDQRATWNLRYRRYNDMMMSNHPKALAEVLGELLSLTKEKKLSFGEKRLLDKVRTLLVGELAAASNVDKSQVEAEIDARFEKAAEEAA